MTVHNRRDATLACLRALFGQHGRGTHFDLEVFLVDDGSTDGTGQAVTGEFPEITLIAADGSLYWAAGMALAERYAAGTDPVAYLWLNDDTFLFEDAVSRLWAAVRHHPRTIAVGATRATASGRITYGGRTRPGPHPLRLGPLKHADQDLACDTFEGNAVLVPAHVRHLIGPIDGSYPHAYADTDYGLRAAAAGVKIIQVGGFVGMCDSPQKHSKPLGLQAAWEDLNSPKGQPWRAQMRILRRHGDWRWPWWLLGGQIAQLSRRMGGRGG